MTGLIILRCPSRPISLPSSESQETDFHGPGFHVHRLPVWFTQQEVLAGDEIVEEKEFREYDAPPPIPMHGLGSSCIPLSTSTAPIREPSPSTALARSWWYQSLRFPFLALGSYGFPLLPDPGCISHFLVPLTLFIPLESVSSLNSPLLTL